MSIQLNIQNRLSLVLWGSVLLAFVITGVGLVLFHSLTLEQRVRQVMEPYVQLIAVGADAAIAFEDPVRAQEILETLRANPQILEADIFLESGQLLAAFSHTPSTESRQWPSKPDGISLGSDSSEWVQTLPHGARLRLNMSLEQLNQQTQQVLWLFAASMLVLLVAKVAQLGMLRRTIVNPILKLTEATERIRINADYQHRVPAYGSDEVAQLGQNFNAMMDAIQEREDALLRLNAFQRTILDHVAFGIISCAIDGTVTSFNPAAERLLGYTAGEVVGKQTPALWHDPEEVAWHAQKLSAELGESISPGFDIFTVRPRRNLSEENEWTFVRKDGGRIPVNLSVTALRDQSGRIIGFVGMTYDLTEHKRAEQELHRLNRELRAISNCNQALVRAEDEQLLLDTICHIICNEGGYRLAWVGYVEHDEAKSVRPVAWGGMDDGYVANAKLSWADDSALGQGPGGTAIRSGKIVYVQDLTSAPCMAPWRESALQRGYHSVIGLPLKDERENVFGVLLIYSTEINAFIPDERRLLEELSDNLAFGIMVLRDRIQRKYAEEKLRRYNDDLEETVQHRTKELMLARDAAEAANKAKSVFLANMSHELRTPLNAILGFSEMLLKNPLFQDNDRRNVEIINRSGEHLLTLINNVLEMAKIEAGRVQLDEAPFDLQTMLRDVVNLMQIRATEKNLQLVVDQSSVFPRYIVGDEARLRQILINLAGNALKFTEQGGVTLRLSTKNNSISHLRIEVEDTGPGIAEEDQKRIFEPFVQLGRLADSKGTGLGLSISRQFVQLMKGSISLESTPGKGSLFRIELPLRQADAADVHTGYDADARDVLRLAPGQSAYRILIVEDQLENQLLLANLMESVGFQIKVAENGGVAVELFKSWQPHLIWMDRQMPVMDGLQATKIIRELPGGNQVKIVAVTASAFAEQREEMLAAGMDDFVRKPYRANEIYDCLSRHLGVQYIYSDLPVAPEEDVVLAPEMLSVLPEALRKELDTTVASLDSECIELIIGQIANYDQQLAAVLTRLAKDYDYASILKALRTQ